MRRIRTKRIRTEGVNLFVHPFQESVLEIQLEKHHQCLLEIQKSRLQKAAQLIDQIEKHESLFSFPHKDRYMIKCFNISVKAYLLHRQTKQYEALKCLDQANQLKNKHQKLYRMKNALNLMIKSVIYCRLGKVEQCKQIIKQCFQTIKSLRDNSTHNPYEKSYEKYNKIFIIFLNMIILQLSKQIKFEEVAQIYKEGHFLSQLFLGKSHKLTLLMRKIISQKDISLQNKKGSRSSKQQNSFQKYQTIKLLNSRKKLKVNQNKILNLSTKERQMKRIYNDNDQIELNKLRLTKRDEKFYLKSLKKVKSIYSSSNGQYNKVRTEPTTQQRNQTIFTKLGDSGDYSRRRIKDIILRGRRLNKDMIYVCDSDYTRTEPNIDATSNTYQHVSAFAHLAQQQQQQKEVKGKVQQTKIAPVVPPIHKQLTLANIALKIEEKQQQRKQACQII